MEELFPSHTIVRMQLSLVELYPTESTIGNWDIFPTNSRQKQLRATANDPSSEVSKTFLPNCGESPA